MPDGYFRAKAGARLACSFVYQSAVTYQVEVLVHQDRRAYDVNIDGKKVYTGLFFAPVASFSRIVFRTGEPRLFPTPETPADRFSDLEQTGAVDPEAIYYIQSLKTEPL